MTNRPVIGWSAREYMWLEAALSDHDPRQAIDDFLEMTGRTRRVTNDKIREMRWRATLNMPSLVDMALALDHRWDGCAGPGRRRRPSHHLCPRCSEQIGNKYNPKKMQPVHRKAGLDAWNASDTNRSGLKP